MIEMFDRDTINSKEAVIDAANCGKCFQISSGEGVLADHLNLRAAAAIRHIIMAEKFGHPISRFDMGYMVSMIACQFAPEDDVDPGRQEFLAQPLPGHGK